MLAVSYLSLRSLETHRRITCTRNPNQSRLSTRSETTVRIVSSQEWVLAKITHNWIPSLGLIAISKTGSWSQHRTLLTINTIDKESRFAKLLFRNSQIVEILEDQMSNLLQWMPTTMPISSFNLPTHRIGTSSTLRKTSCKDQHRREVIRTQCKAGPSIWGSDIKVKGYLRLVYIIPISHIYISKLTLITLHWDSSPDRVLQNLSLSQ